VAVNVGPGRAVRWLQKAAGVPQDGMIGPVTASVVNGAELVGLMGRFLGLACKHYLALAKPKYQDGWLRRLFDF
jgi:lysozyme family protein